jgi:aminoglycoside/choline kinase family phosphotransferase
MRGRVTDEARGTTEEAPPCDAAVASWLAAHGLTARAVVPLVGDVSSRSYFRAELAGERSSWIVARYPPELRSAQRRFAAARVLLAGAGVRVPALRLDEPEAGFALVEDLGPATLYEVAGDWRRAPRELDSALAAARAVAGLDRRAVAALGSPALDAALLRRELEQSLALLEPAPGVDVAALAAALDALCGRLAGALVPCHRDFMARNLMPLAATGELGVLDFQDLRLGPVGYDVASLLNDSLFADGATEERSLAAAGALAGDAAQYRAAVVQRSLKAVGTYLAFARRGKTRHLALVAPTLERALRFFPALPETAALGAATIEALRRAGARAAVC